MLSRLPEFADPWHLADFGKVFSGKVELSDLPRLCTALVSSEGEAVFRLSFGRIEKRWVHIGGFVQATLILECQRCLDDMQLQIDSELNLVVVENSAEANAIPVACEPVQLENRRVRLMDLIEDELLLSIPQSPMHERLQCKRKLDTPFFSSGSPEKNEITEKANPFSVLARLKSD